MNRRHFMKLVASAPLVASTPCLLTHVAWAAAPTGADYRKLLVLIELKGGNDGLNTLVPHASEAYYALRPKLAIARDQVIKLSDRVGLHPALEPLLPFWKSHELAVLQGVGYPAPNLSHFRSIEIWDTASKSEEYLQDGWLTRAFAAAPTPLDFAADGIIIGSADLGPLAGSGTRAIALANAEQFLRRARYVTVEGQARNKALQHILKVEAAIVQAASRLNADYALKTEFPPTAFGNAIKTACQVIASPAGVAVVRLLGELATGIAALKAALEELGRWNDSLLLTYAEFGRRPKENLSNGTDHGTSSVHFALGGRVVGGLYGEQPSLERLSSDGNLGYALDFRSIYATVLERLWHVASAPALGGKFATVPFLPA